MIQYFQKQHIFNTCIFNHYQLRGVRPGSGSTGSGEKDYKYFLLSALGSWPNTDALYDGYQ